MDKHKNLAGIPIPNGWPRRARSAMLHVISLAQYAMAYTGQPHSNLVKIQEFVE